MMLGKFIPIFEKLGGPKKFHWNAFRRKTWGGGEEYSSRVKGEERLWTKMATIELDKRIWNRNVSRRNELWNLRSFGHSKNTRQLKLYAGQLVSSSKCYFNLETIFNFQWKFQFRRAIRVCQLSVEEQNERISVIEENRRNKIDKTKLRGSCGRRGGGFRGRIARHDGANW